MPSSAQDDPQLPLKAFRWSRVQPAEGTSLPPEHRSPYTFTREGKLYFVGGWIADDRNNATYYPWDEVWEYDPKTLTWRCFKTEGAAPPTRHNEAVCSNDAMLYLYGGSEDRKPLTNLWQLDLKMWKWQWITDTAGRGSSSITGAKAS